MLKKLFDKMQYLFTIKSPKILEIESAELNIKAAYGKPIAIIILNGELKAFQPKPGKR